MNPEQEVLLEIIEANSVLRLIVHLIAKQDREEVDLLEVVPRDQTGLSPAQSQKAIDWLIRKGFLRGLTEDQYPRVKARYTLNPELKEKASEWKCVPFGYVGTRMLQTTAEKFDMPSPGGGDIVLWTRPDGNVLDHTARLIGREEATEVKRAIEQYLKKHEVMSEEQFEKHRESHESFLWWGSLIDPYLRQLIYRGDITRYLRPLVCDCDQCREFHKLAFTTLTNYFNYEKQEKKQIRLALKMLI